MCPFSTLKRFNYYYLLCYVLSDASATTCKKFYSFIQGSICWEGHFNTSVSPEDVLVPPAQLAVFEQFDTISLLTFTEVVSGIKPPNCLLDIILAELLKKVLILVGSSLLVFTNFCLTAAAPRHAVARPSLKNTS